MKALLIAATLLAVASVAALPTANSQASVSCGFDAWYWHLAYSCHVGDAGAAGVVAWCPEAVLCLDDRVLACWFDLSPPWYCQV